MKEIQGYPGYFVSEDGQIISKKTGRVLKPSLTKGYRQAILCIKGKPHSRYVHRLVAQAFIPNPENKPEVNHKNGIKDDNRVENLEWCTAAENIRHAQDTGLKPALKGEAHGNSKLTEEQVREIKQNTQGLSQRALGKLYGVSAAIVNRVRAGKAWAHVK